MKRICTILLSAILLAAFCLAPFAAQAEPTAYVELSKTKVKTGETVKWIIFTDGVPGEAVGFECVWTGPNDFYKDIIGEEIGEISFPAEGKYCLEAYVEWIWHQGQEDEDSGTLIADPVYVTVGNEYTVTLTNNGHGTAKASPASGLSGTKVTLSAYPDSGYRFKEWKVLSGGVTIKNNQFTIGKQNVKIQAVFEPIPADIAKAKITAVPNQVYTGKAIRPAVTVTLGTKKLTAGTDYEVAFKDNVSPGKATVTVKGKGKYTGTKTGSFIILPQQVKLSSLKAGKKKLTVKWKQGPGVDGYEIEYSLKKTFKNAKKITVSAAKTVKASVKKLKAKKTYYVRIRAYKVIGGTKYYSAWSKVLKKKVK